MNVAAEEVTMTIGGGIEVEPGTYLATLTDLTDFTYDDAEGSKTLRRWTFAADDWVDAAGNHITLDGVSSLATGPKSKAYGWTAALLGRTPVTGETLRKSDLVGRDAMVTVILNDDGFSKIATVVPAPKRKGAAPTSSPDELPFK